MPYTITLPSKLNDQEILSFPNGLASPCIVDARELGFVEPIGLVQLTLLLHHLHTNKASVQFLAPSSSEVNTYLWRMDFYDRIPAAINVKTPQNVSGMNRTDRSNVLIGLNGFDTDIAVEDLSPRVLPHLRSMQLPPTIYLALQNAIPELCGNVTAHSGSACGGFLAAQTYKGVHHCMAVGDIGRGIRSHLTRNPKYAHVGTDEEAIRTAIKPDVSGTLERRGWGFEVVMDHLKDTKSAQLLIRSGNGWVRTYVGNGRLRKQESGTIEELHVPGTLVQLAIRKA